MHLLSCLGIARSRLQAGRHSEDLKKTPEGKIGGGEKRMSGKPLLDLPFPLSPPLTFVRFPASLLSGHPFGKIKHAGGERVENNSVVWEGQRLSDGFLCPWHAMTS